MKTEYIALSPTGFFCLFVVGVLVGTAVYAPDLQKITTLAIAAIIGLHVRSDAVIPIANGTYRRRFCLWRKNVEIDQEITRPETEAKRVTLQ